MCWRISLLDTIFHPPSFIFHLPSSIFPSFTLHSTDLPIANMTFLGKLQQTSPPTSIVPVKEEATSVPLDLEKSHLRGSHGKCTLQSNHRNVLSDTERKVVRKMDFRIIPLVTACYILAFLDRSNIGKYVALKPTFSLFKPHISSLEACLATSILSSLFQGSILNLQR